jgi:triacylglycerol lipase
MQVDAGRAPLWKEAFAVLKYRQLRRDPSHAGAGIPDGGGQPVLVLPGFLASDPPMQTMINWLRRTGHRAEYAQAGVNLWCGERTMQRLEQRLEALGARYGRRIVVVGHSRGGQFARALGVRRPDLVAGVATLGTPPLDLGFVHPVIRLQARWIGLVARLGGLDTFGAACFSGPCCEDFRRDLLAPLPDSVALVSIVGRRDGFVDRRACADAAGEVVEVNATHAGTIVNAETYRELAAFIARAGSVPARRSRSRRATSRRPTADAEAA